MRRQFATNQYPIRQDHTHPDSVWRKRDKTFILHRGHAARNFFNTLTYKSPEKLVAPASPPDTSNRSFFDSFSDLRATIDCSTESPPLWARPEWRGLKGLEA
jgi:hypothetical protein